MNVDDKWMNERELLERAKRNDAEACHFLVEHYTPFVYNYFRGLELPPDLVDDLTSETLTTFFESLHRFRGDSALKTWLYGIAHNIRCRYFGEKKRSLKALSRDFIERFRSLYQDDTPDPEEDFLLAERKQHLRIALRTLPVEFREILVFRFMEELSLEETASILKIPAGTVKSRTYRAKAMLRDKMEALKEEATTRKAPSRKKPSRQLTASGEHYIYATQTIRNESRAPRS